MPYDSALANVEWSLVHISKLGNFLVRLVQKVDQCSAVDDLCLSSVAFPIAETIFTDQPKAEDKTQHKSTSEGDYDSEETRWI